MLFFHVRDLALGPHVCMDRGSEAYPICNPRTPVWVDSKSRLWNDPSDPHVRVLWYAGMQKSVNEMSHFKAVPRCLGPWL